jgi:Putative zinc-finger
MTHPEELLAGYVDDSLTPSERVEIDAHLATCATCREEIALATRSVTLLADLPEESVPVGVMNPVMTQIGRQRAGRTRRRWAPRMQWVAGVAAAAAVIALAAVVLPQLGRQAGMTAAPNASPNTAAEGAQPSPAAVPLEVQKSTDYTAARLETLTRNPSKRTTNATDEGGPSPQMVAVLSAQAQTAEACLRRPGGITVSDHLVRLIQAKFQGTPAYIGMYKEGNPPARIVIWVVSKPDCRILSFFSKRL